jgi:hypothetical protein
MSSLSLNIPISLTLVLSDLVNASINMYLLFIALFRRSYINFLWSLRDLNL